jgi:pimeloyl-ACP methyl ester carboxylesterase
LKPERRMTVAAPLSASETVRLPVRRHGSDCRQGAEGSYRLDYFDWGRPDNSRVVVCMHGYGRAARDFDVLARDLSAHFRVICPDLAIRGDSDWLGKAEEHDFAQLLADLKGLLLGLGIEKVDWIGASLGGVLGIHLAVQPASFVRRLVMKNIGECMPMASSPHPGHPLCAPLAGVHSADLWKQLMCPTILLRGDGLAVTLAEVDVIRRFLLGEARAGRRESYATAPA